LAYFFICKIIYAHLYVVHILAPFLHHLSTYILIIYNESQTQFANQIQQNTPRINSHCRIVTDNTLNFLDITFNFPLILNLEFWGNPLLLIVSLLKTCRLAEHTCKLASVRYLLNHTNSFSLSLKTKRKKLPTSMIFWTITPIQLSSWIPYLKKKTLFQHTPFIIPTKCTFLISTDIKWASTFFSMCVPSSGRTQCHFLKNICYSQSCYLQVPWSVTALSLTMIICKRYNCAYFKNVWLHYG